MKKLLTTILCILLAAVLLVGCSSGGGGTAPSSGGGDAPASTPGRVEVTGGAGGAGGFSSVEVVDAEEYKDTFVIGGQMPITDMDSQVNTSTYVVTQCVYDTLVTFANNEFSPALATEWEQTGDLTWEFKLRDDVTFQDGSKFTADDVVFTLGERLYDVPGTMTSTKLACVEKVEALNDYAVKFTLNVQNQDFLLFIAQPYCCIMSRSACAADAEKGFYIGTGPWKVTDYAPGLSVTMERYDGFWGELPKPKQMTYVFYPEDSTRFIALQSGDIDACIVVNSADRDAAVQDPNIHVTDIRDSGLPFVTFNLTDSICGDLNFRKAVGYAINVQDLIMASSDGNGDATPTFWGAGTYAEYTDCQGFEYDVEKAKEFLAQSNYDGSTITITSAIPEFVKNATIIADQLKDIGVEAVVDERDMIGMQTYATYENPTHQMVSYTTAWTSSADDCRRYFYSGQHNNRAHIDDPYLDDLIDSALIETDADKRVEMYHEIQQYVIDNAFYIPLFHAVYPCACLAGAGGIEWSSISSHHNFRYACTALEG